MGVQIGSKVKNMRLSKSISQNALAKKAGIAQSTLSYIESGKKHPQFDTLSAICKALDTSVLDLLSFGEQRSSKKLFEERRALIKALEMEGAISAGTQQEFEKYLFDQMRRANGQ